MIITLIGVTSFCNNSSNGWLFPRFDHNQCTNIVLCHLQLIYTCFQFNHWYFCVCVCVWNERVEYRFDSIINRIISGAPEPWAISTFSFSFQDIRNGGAFKAMFFHTRSSWSWLMAWQHKWLKGVHLHHTNMLEDCLFHKASMWHQGSDSSLHILFLTIITKRLTKKSFS